MKKIYLIYYSVIIEDLDEGSYEFNVYTQDPNGNLSISQTVAGSVIGDEFISDQNPREVLDYSLNPRELCELLWKCRIRVCNIYFN